MSVVDPMEQAVEEAHCGECNTPMPSIPGWYAQVRVKFTCDNCRQKSPRMSALPALDALEAPRATGEADPEIALDEAVLEDEEVADLDAETEEPDLAEPVEE